MYKGFYGTVISHIFSLFSTIWSFLHIELSDLCSADLIGLRLQFSLVLLNSAFAIVRYGNSDFGYKLRKAHIITLNLSTVFSVTIIEALLHHSLNSSVYLLISTFFNLIPFLYNVTAKDYRVKYHIRDGIIAFNGLTFLVVSYVNNNYNGVAFMLSFIFGYFIVGESGYFLDTEVPSIDTYQYLQCFLNYFTVTTFSY